MMEFLLGGDPPTVYAGLFLLLMTGAIGFPPEDVSLILGGIAASVTDAKLWVVLVIGYLGTILSDLSIYAVGRRFGPAIFSKPWVAKRISQERMRQTRVSLERRSLLMIFVARHLFYFRSVTFLVCGAVKMKFIRFLVADCLAALISVPLMISVGYMAGEHYEVVFDYLRQAKRLSLVLGIVLALSAFVYLWYRRRQAIYNASGQIK